MFGSDFKFRARLNVQFFCIILYYTIIYYIQNYEYQKKNYFFKLCFCGLENLKQDWKCELN
jgi:hypothetical protein